MKNSISIRAYKPQDYSVVEKNLKNEQMFAEAWDSEENLNDMIEKNPESILVAEVEGRIVGQILMVPYGGHVAFLFRLTVDQNYREKGVGSTLLESAEKLLKKKGLKEIALFVNDDKENLKEYYKKRDYQSSGNKFVVFWKRLI